MGKNTDLSRKRVKILNVYVDSTSMSRVLEDVKQKLRKKIQFYIVTPNPEIVLEANNDPKLAEIINKADFSIPDGVGLKLADSKLNIIQGRKLVLELFGLARELNLKVFFITSNVLDTNRKLLNKFREEYKGIQAEAMVGAKINKKGETDTELDSKVNKDTIIAINKFKPDLLFVCFGAAKQEKWIASNLKKLNVKLAIGVGGALDYYAGTAKLPPVWMDDLGLEWLWRLINEPKRLIRIINSVFVFPLKFMITK